MQQQKYVNENIIIENARLMFKNFSGEETQFNRAGDRNFCAVIEDADKAAQLLADGWNIKQLPVREEGDEPTFIINVSVAFDKKPPRIFMVSGSKKTEITEETVGCLDYAEIKHVDLVINPYNWNVRGQSGVKAYLHTLYVTIEEDPFAYKYE